MDPLDQAKEWGRRSLKCRSRGSKHIAAHVEAEAELPLPPLEAFQLMAHPDNAAIFRGIERCTFRNVVWSSGCIDGPQTVEVENESDWHFLFFKGSIQTRMVVQEDPLAGIIQVRLAPEGGTAPLEHMTGKWTFGPGRTPSSSHVTLEQEVHPRGLHPFFHNGFRAVASLQVRKTFEDLYAKALRMNAGKPSLAPYSEVAGKAIAADGAAAVPVGRQPGSGRKLRGGLPTVREEGAEDPASVLTAAYEEDSSSSSSASGPGLGSSTVGRSRGNPDRLRSHPIGSLLDLACLAGVTGASLAAEAAANAAAAAAEVAAAAAKDARAVGGSWRGRLYWLVERLWKASNAALGATEQLEEMAVLV